MKLRTFLVCIASAFNESCTDTVLVVQWLKFVY